MLKLGFAAFLSRWHPSSPVSTIPSGECKAITNRWYGESGLTFCLVTTVGTNVAEV
jgi:hypothetical protein